MPAYDFRSPRLYVEDDLSVGLSAALSRDQAHYLVNVLRLGNGTHILAFNGRDGEWLAALTVDGKRSASLTPVEQTRPQPASTDLSYSFAPLKHARLDYMVQKAVEMGASALCPVITQHTQVARVNLDRMRANAIEAAEQCGVLSIPAVSEARSFAAFIADLDPTRLLVFCDEAAVTADGASALKDAGFQRGGKLGVLIGPEGGFSAAERETLSGLPNVVRIALGPRILRADTAAVAALTLVQSTLGDWR